MPPPLLRPPAASAFARLLLPRHLSQLRCPSSSDWAGFKSLFRSPAATAAPELPRFCLCSASGREYSSAAASSSTAASTRDRKSRKTLAYLVGIACAMVGASYAAVPLYRRFCQATGYGGTVQRRESVEEKIARHARDGTATERARRCPQCVEDRDPHY
ncbi:hypothetical protein Taro_010400 [Colocasia esculenta]|uniref:Uncharacterized protein n=1 Tax=Colocasia esculenta TaxID=4460 RepID=A0A843U9G4_COLES|nr:hypothetical protein [Colocasia esculenta]